MSRVFVAGGTGVLGRAALEPLVFAGHQVLSSARGRASADLVRRAGAEPVEVDLYDPTAVRQAIRGSNVLIRLTTKIGALSTMRSARAWDETNRLRTVGARVLVDAAIAEGVEVYVHESVTFVYQDGGSDWLDERTGTDDAGTAILRATLEGERETERFSQSGGRGVVLRFGGFYGPDAPSAQEMLKMARKRMLAQIGPGSNYFSSIYVPDAGRAVAAAIGVPAGIYNVTDDEPLRFADYLAALVSAADAPKPLRLPGFVGRVLFGDVWKYFSRSHRVSNAKLKTASDWRPHVASVREGWPLTARGSTSSA